MADLYARLLAEIAEQALCRGREEWYCVLGEEPPFIAALRAAVELHAPETTGPEVWCPECDYASWPCSTIRVIAEQLGVPIDKSITEKEGSA